MIGQVALRATIEITARIFFEAVCRERDSSPPPKSKRGFRLASLETDQRYSTITRTVVGPDGAKRSLV